MIFDPHEYIIPDHIQPYTQLWWRCKRMDFKNPDHLNDISVLFPWQHPIKPFSAPDGNTAIHCLMGAAIYYARFNKHPIESLKDLIGLCQQSGAMINQKNEDHETALFLAALNLDCVAYRPLIEYFIEQGGDINAQNIEGFTPLNHKLMKQSLMPEDNVEQNINTLIDLGADPRLGYDAVVAFLQENNISKEQFDDTLAPFIAKYEKEQLQLAVAHVSTKNNIKKKL